jgi:hypothetical protein
LAEQPLEDLLARLERERLEADRLERIFRTEAASAVAQRLELATLVAAVNAHADTLDARPFSSMAYAVIARR